MRNKLRSILPPIALAAFIGLVLAGFDAEIRKEAHAEKQLVMDACAPAGILRLCEERRQDVSAALDRCRSDLRKLDHFAEAREAVADMPYRNPGNNCYDHAKALQVALRAQNVLSFIATTEDANGDGLDDHAYVLVAYEAVTGELAPGKGYIMSDYVPIKGIRDDSLEVICGR